MSRSDKRGSVARRSRDGEGEPAENICNVLNRKDLKKIENGGTMPKTKTNDPGAHHASSGALIRRFLPYLAN